MQLLKFASLVTGILALTSCGGGGGGSGGGGSVPISATATTTAQSLAVGSAMISFSPLTASGGATPYTYSVTTGTLPSGLSLNSGTGAVTGTPTATYATANVVFSVKDANNVVASTTSTVSFIVTDVGGTTHAIGGTVSGAVSFGVTITVSGTATATATTGAGGTYSVSGLSDGSYTVTPSLTGYTFTPNSTNVTLSGADVTDKNFTSASAVAATSKLNDTGITSSQCYQAGSDVLVVCNSTGAIALDSAQDGMTGRDANVDTNGNADGKLGFDFSDFTVGTEHCVQDNVTGLLWEVKTNDGGLRDGSKRYTNYGENIAGEDASSFVAAVNGATLCGYNDWRLPTVDELHSIVDYSVASPGTTIDGDWFPNTSAVGGFWSSSVDAVTLGAYGWIVNFYDGNVETDILGSANHVRLVRGAQTENLNRYTFSTDGSEVTDQKTGLIWRRCAEGMSYSGGTCSGTPSYLSQEAALQRAAAVRSPTAAWRLPNVKELASIVDRSQYHTLTHASIDAAVFPATPVGGFWSSSPYVGLPIRAWYVNFFTGEVNGTGYLRTTGDYVRLVRTGQ